MNHLLNHWEQCKDTFEGKPLALFLDFDGTLSPIAATPDEAVFPKKNKDLLEKIAKCKKCKIAVVSGRSLKDIKKRVNIRQITYVGNHGLEIEGPQIKFEYLIPKRIQDSIHQLKEELTSALSSIKGLLFDEKGLTLSIHYRLVPSAQVLPVKKIFTQTSDPYRKRGDIQVTFGKKVMEIRPPVKWNKGHAVSWLLDKYQPIENHSLVPFYIGDDETDEDAFSILKDSGVTSVVGEQPTAAEYYLQNQKEVTKVLQEIAHLYS
jgi:trehalose 6-phosphate phosphatase